jgi:tetratricopeptide (TPR) repeat protein
LEKAEKRYRTALDVIAKAQQVTMDPQVLEDLAGLSLRTRLRLVEVMLDLERAKEVSPLLDELEQMPTIGPDALEQVWTLRIRALEAQGKLDDATTMFDALAQRSPDAPGLAGAAGVLARALDREAQALYDADPKSARAKELWRKAAQSYWMSVKSGLEGTAPLRPDDVGLVAQRLYVIGLIFNDVPEGQQTFVDWQGRVVDPGPWEDAARIYARLDEQAPSYRISNERARTLGLLGKAEEAERIYARLFDQNPIVSDGAGNGFDRSVVEARPELVSAYLEWGVATNLVGLAAGDQERLDRASQIYARMLDNSTPSSRTWWQAKYYQIKSLADRGEYDLADTAIRNTKRTTDTRFDKGEFGFEPKFAALEAEVSKKVFKK